MENEKGKYLFTVMNKGRDLISGREPRSGGDGTKVPQGSVDLFDRGASLEKLLHDEALILRVLDTFVADIPCQISALRAALIAADTAGARRQAHTIKGAAANVGAVALSRLADTMERLCETGRLADVTDLLPSLDTLWGATVSALGMPRPLSNERNS